MLEIPVPGRETLRLEHLVLDWNGTLALDGVPLDGVAERLAALAGRLAVRVVTADTFGTVKARTADLPVEVEVLPPGHQDERKLEIVRGLGAERVAAVGNGRNDALMLGAAALGIVVVQGEGAAVATLAAADVVAPDIRVALDLLLEPRRLAATLRT